MLSEDQIRKLYNKISSTCIGDNDDPGEALNVIDFILGEEDELRLNNYNTIVKKGSGFQVNGWAE